MAKYSVLIEETKIALQDGGDIDEERVKLALNEAYKEIVDETEIPSLKQMTVVTTVVNQAWLNMPEGFSGRLRYVGNTYGKLNILDGGLEALLEDYPGLTKVGSVEAVALQGNLLWYQGIPSTPEDLTILFYADVDDMEADDDTPDYLPDYLHRDLLVNKAAFLEYKRIEDGIEGEKVNTLKYGAYYEDAKSRMQEWLARRRRHISRSVWDV